MSMGDRIKYLRESIGMTQDELGERLGIQKSAVAKYEAGKVENIKRSYIKIMADIFGVSPCFLLGFDEDEETEKKIAEQTVLLQQIQRHWGKDAVNLLENFTQLNTDGKKKVLSQAEDLTEIPKYKTEE